MHINEYGVYTITVSVEKWTPLVRCGLLYTVEKAGKALAMRGSVVSPLVHRTHT